MKSTAQEEAEYILNFLHNKNLLETIKYLDTQFNVLVTRTQSLLGLITVTITLSGISGVQIIPKNKFAGAFIIVGLTLGVLAAIISLLGILSIRWATSFKNNDPINLITHLIERRNAKTKKFVISTFLFLFAILQFLGCFISFYLS